MDKYIYAKNSVEFVTVGVEFCAFLERVQELTQEEFASTSIKLLPLLISKRHSFPSTMKMKIISTLRNIS